jgi:hypothetical protein
MKRNDDIPDVGAASARGGRSPEPFSYRIDADRALVFLVYGSSAPSFDEWRGAMDALLRDPMYRAGMAFVSDRRRLTAAPTTEMVQRMSAYESEHREQLGPCRFAVVTDPASLADFGMARMSQAVLEGNRSRIVLRPFTDMERATRWATTGVDEEE